MSDLRDPCPEHLTIAPRLQTGNETWEIDIRLATYHSVDIAKVAPKTITFVIKAMGFEEATAQAMLLRDAYKPLFDIWMASIVRVERKTA